MTTGNGATTQMATMSTGVSTTSTSVSVNSSPSRQPHTPSTTTSHPPVSVGHGATQRHSITPSHSHSSHGHGHLSPATSPATSPLPHSSSATSLSSLKHHGHARGSTTSVASPRTPHSTGTNTGSNLIHIEYKNLHFIIMDAPTDATLPSYIEVMRQYNVHHLVRCCERSYAIARLVDADITVHEMFFTDGEFPPEDVLDRWFHLIGTVFNNKTTKKETEKIDCIAVHCVAGLGRAPVLITIALIERGMEMVDAVAYMRRRRRGAINAKQLNALQIYVPRRQRRDGCTIM